MKSLTHRPIKRNLLSIIFWALLFYMILALAYWFFALEKQNRQIEEIRLQQVPATSQQHPAPVQEIERYANRKTIQYIAEGLTFLAFILVGAVFVFRATRRQFRLSEQQQNLMMAISHELKTPIAITRLNLETLQKRTLDTPTQQKLLHNSLLETNRLNSLCSNILLAAQFDSGLYRAASAPVNLSAILQKSVEENLSRFNGRQIQLLANTDVMIAGEEWLLMILMNNLIENALKYSPADKPIEVSLTHLPSGWEVAVCDQGPGVEEGEQRNIFKKFYRTGSELTRQKKGTGLGLYLCKKIADSHGATITVTNQVTRGSRFAVLFPMQHAI
jgi:two-component system sensor histidine kinase CiaH